MVTKNSLKPEKKLAFSYKPTCKDSTKFQDILLFHRQLYLETPLDFEFYLCFDFEIWR